MNIVKRTLAIALVAVMAVSFCGCHKKNETAVKVGKVNFTSGYYMCALLNADLAARNEIDTKAQTDDSIDTTKEGYYYSQKFDGKKYVDYVKDNALEALKTVAAYRIKFDDAKLKLTEDEESQVNQEVDFYWDTYGYSKIFEPNGVSKETYTTFTRDNYLANSYFNYLYGKDGKKAITDEEITTYLNDNYCLADVVESSSYSTMEEDEKTSTLQNFNAYLTSVKSGSIQMTDVYSTENSTEDSSSQQTGSPTTLVGSSETGYAKDYFDDVKAMANDEVKVVTDESGSYLALVAKKDIASDTSVKDGLDSEIRQALKGEELKKEIEKYVKTLKLTEIKSSTKRFDVKKIEYPETEQ